MSAVLTVQSQVSCPHQGQVMVPIPSQARLRVGGLAVLPADVSFNPIQGCRTQPDPQTSTVPCLAVANLTGGQATKLRVGGRPVLLATLAGSTTGRTVNDIPAPALSADAGQTRLTAE